MLNNGFNQHDQFLSPEQSGIIKKIENYGAHYNNPDSGLSLEDQLLACEAIAESSPIIEHGEIEKIQATIGQVFSVSGSVSGACYSEVNLALISSYSEAIQELKLCKSDETPPINVAAILEEVLGSSRKSGHWLYLSQRWNPRQIVWVLNQIYKEIQTGQISSHEAADAFTFRLKKRRKKKKLLKLRRQHDSC